MYFGRSKRRIIVGSREERETKGYEKERKKASDEALAKPKSNRVSHPQKRGGVFGVFWSLETTDYRWFAFVVDFACLKGHSCFFSMLHCQGLCWKH